jgi:thiol-disulfide isomerase/thioredoxin
VAPSSTPVVLAPPLGTSPVPAPDSASTTAAATAPAPSAAPADGPAVWLKNGTRIACLEPPIVALGKVLFKTPDGERHAVAMDIVDLDKTKPAAPPEGDRRASGAPVSVPTPQARLETPAAKTAGKDDSKDDATPAPPDFEGMRLDGSKVKLSQLKGKVVLVDFWATWCGPCMMEMPNVKNVYKKLGGDDFEIMGVSLDQDQDKMRGYLQSQGITWPQYFDGRGWGNQVAHAYGVSSIPTAYLVNKKGKVVQAGMRGQALEYSVAELLAEK